MYIVLEDANITGSISNFQNTREICIISIGNANSIIGGFDDVAINISNSSLYIYSEAELVIKGKDGKTGEDGENGIPVGNIVDIPGSNG